MERLENRAMLVIDIETMEPHDRRLCPIRQLR
jgi:hypothetical protein